METIINQLEKQQEKLATLRDKLYRKTKIDKSASAVGRMLEVSNAYQQLTETIQTLKSASEIVDR